MDRYKMLFSRLREKNEAAFIPFLVIGYPDPDSFVRLVCKLVDEGVDAIELGISFSDPVADGRVVQEAYQHVLKNGVSVQDAFSMIGIIRKRYPDLPIGLLVYANVIHSTRGFYESCLRSGVDSVLAADVPLEEDCPWGQVGSEVKRVFILPPYSTEELVEKVASRSEGYVYVSSRAGVTGVCSQTKVLASAQLELLQKYHSAPPVLGFGISGPDMVSNAVRAGFAGVIAGSAIIKKITSCEGSEDKMLESVSQFVGQMKAATVFNGTY